MTVKKILVVDDEDNIHKVLKRILTSTNVQPLFAFNGAEALQLAKEKKPDLILLDINMPKMDGNEVMRELRKSDDTKSIPVIMLTGNGETIDKVVGFELGVQDYITKPFDITDLRERVENVVGRLSS
jgi:DNA-binding response OmpR family regulator